jgi:hypothetical protein
LARYYKTKRVLPPTWKYESGTASALVAWKKIYHFQVVYVSCLLAKLTEYIWSTSHVSSISVLLLVGFRRVSKVSYWISSDRSCLRTKGRFPRIFVCFGVWTCSFVIKPKGY